MLLTQKQALLPISRGEIPAGLVLKNAQVVDVFSEQTYKADIAIHQGYIAGVGVYKGEREIDMQNRYVCPGFIDAHVHIESSMASAFLFSKAVLPHGTTSVVADPHELVNVAGARGMDYFLRDSEHALINVYFSLPSCVPLGDDHNGATFSAKDMAPYVEDRRVVSLGEVMDFLGAKNGSQDLLQKIELLKHKTIDGHAPSLTGSDLCAYKLCGVDTEHECASFTEALEKLRRGFYILLREGSAAHNLEDILGGAIASGISLDRFLFCTDDKHLDSIAQQGHIDYNIKLAVKLGLNPVKAIKLASYNASRAYNLPDTGAVAPGYKADLVVLDDLETIKIHDVIKSGVFYSQMPACPAPQYDPNDPIYHTVHIPQITKEQLKLKSVNIFPVLSLIPHQILTRRESIAIPQQNGEFTPKNGLLKAAVVQRHDFSGQTAVGVVKGFGNLHGAIATTIAHDAHNLIIIGDNDEDMLLAIEELKRVQGGYTIVQNGAVLKTLPLRVGGLFTDDETLPLSQTIHQMLDICHQIGVEKDIDPFQNLSFLSLCVIPSLRITDQGVFDVEQQRYLL